MTVWAEILGLIVLAIVIAMWSLSSWLLWGFETNEGDEDDPL